jgi:hypothetical protein
MMGACLSVLVAVFAASEVCFPALATSLLAESAPAFAVSVAFLPALVVGVAAGLLRPVMPGMLGKLGR